VANTILSVETSNTFNQWRIATNSLISAANELRNNTYIKDGGGIQISNGTIQVVNGAVQLDKTTGTTLYVASNATVVGTFTVGTIVANTISANITSPQVIAAYGQANLAYTAANNAANTVRVTGNSGTAQSAVSLNFVNTSSVTVTVGAGATGNANVAFSAVAGTTAIAGILQLTDSVTSTSTTTAATPNSVRIANTIAIAAYSQANLAYTQANTGINTAIAAYSAANASVVRFYSNGGSPQSNVGINFVNTFTVLVSVGTATAGNSNVAFSVIPSFATEINTTSTLAVTGRSTLSNTLTINANTDLDAIRVNQLGQGNVIVFEDSTNPDSTPFIIDQNGYILSGHTASLSGGQSSLPSNLQINNWLCTQEAFWSNNLLGPVHQFLKANSAGTGIHGVVKKNDQLGQIQFAGSNGTSFLRAAGINVGVEDGVDATNMPASMSFTTRDVGDAAPQIRMIIANTGFVGFGITSPEAKAHISTKAIIDNQSGATSILQLRANTATVDNNAWNFGMVDSSGKLRIQALTDTYSGGSNYIDITRNAQQVTGVSIKTGSSNDSLLITQTGSGNALSVVGNSVVSGVATFTGTVVAAPVVSVSANASYTENAAGKTIVVNSASPVTLTFGAAAYSGFVVDIIRKGAGVVTIANNSTIAKLNVASTQSVSNISSQYAAARVTYTATNEFILTGSITP